MKVDVKTVDEFTGIVAVDGVEIGEVSDCDLGRWVLCVDNDEMPTDNLFNGCYEAKDLFGVAYAIRECVAGVTSIHLDGVEIA